MPSPSKASRRETLSWRLDPSTVPDTEDLFEELSEVYDDVDRLRSEIEQAFNESPARSFLGGFASGGRSQLDIEWKGPVATVKITEL